MLQEVVKLLCLSGWTIAGWCQATTMLLILCREAANNGNLQVLDWFLDNGVDHDSIHYNAVCHAAGRGVVTFLEWAKDHGYDFTHFRNRHVSATAAHNGNLFILKWLRQNDCSWDFRVVAIARLNGHEDVAEWAIANGCPAQRGLQREIEA